MLDRFARFSLAIAEIDRCWHKLAAEEMANYELNSPHAVYLNTLYSFEEGLTATQLAELCCKNKADVSRMTSILEEKGFLRRQNMDGKLYRAKLVLTQEGRRAAEHIRRRAAVAVEMAGAGISDADRETFYRCLEQIAEKLQFLCREGLPEKEGTV
ncbi:MAG: MarR family transcriptional regulator [Oscillospiraceae bacterium]|nr:MarR family transcriptional regulator [Oscillospiraceae bacterium]